ncbi:MAG TPA: MarR family transcriptional regulator [Steroidobacteraceae bacterium]|nr:MarR family transcriptional regulator [Steroidobacteraceae bacterium]
MSTEIYDANTYEPRKSVGHLMNRVRTAMFAALDAELGADTDLARFEVSAAQFVVIASLAMGEADSASQLCKGISYDAGAMTRMIDRLESKGLIRRRRDADDRRLVNIELTEQGREAFPKMRQCAMGVLNRFLRGFTQNEARQLESFLNRMLENS